MKRIQSLNRFQKAVLAVTAVMMLLFTAIYLMAASRKGFLYQNALLIPQQADDRTFYIGEIRGIRYNKGPVDKIKYGLEKKVSNPYFLS